MTECVRCGHSSDQHGATFCLHIARENFPHGFPTLQQQASRPSRPCDCSGFLHADRALPITVSTE